MSYGSQMPPAVLFGQAVTLTKPAEGVPTGDYDFIATFTDERLKDLPAIPVTSNMRGQAHTSKALPPEMKARWLTALRSGEYPQGQSYLTQISDSGTAHCCLGVLADLDKVPFHNGKDCEDAIRIYSFDSGSSSTWLGGRYLDLLPEKLQHTLGELNDSGEWSFEQIAQLLEVIL